MSDLCAVIMNGIFKVKSMPQDVSGNSFPVVIPVKRLA